MNQYNFYSGEAMGASPDYMSTNMNCSTLVPDNGTLQFNANGAKVIPQEYLIDPFATPQDLAYRAFQQQQQVQMMQSQISGNPYGTSEFMNQSVSFGAMGYNNGIQSQQYMENSMGTYNSPYHISDPNLNGADRTFVMNNPALYQNNMGMMNNPYLNMNPAFGMNTMGGSINPAFDMGRPSINPAFGMMGNPYMGSINPAFGMNMGYQQPKFEDKVVHRPGMAFAFGVRDSKGLKEACEKLDIEKVLELEEESVKREESYGMNYTYNGGFMNSYYGYGYEIENKYKQKVYEMVEEAKNTQKNMFRNMLLCCQNFIDDPIPEEEIDRLVNGDTYTVPASTFQAIYSNDRLAYFRPVDTMNNPVRKAFEEIKMTYDYLMKGKEETIENYSDAMVFVNKGIEIADSIHERRNYGNRYASNSYRNLIRNSLKKKGELNNTPSFNFNPGAFENKLPENRNLPPIRDEKDGKVQFHIGEGNSKYEGTEKGYTEYVLGPNENIPRGKDFPLMNESCTLNPDGTLNLSAPPWMTSSDIENQYEQEYQKTRNEFLQSIYNLK